MGRRLVLGLFLILATIAVSPPLAQGQESEKRVHIQGIWWRTKLAPAGVKDRRGSKLPIVHIRMAGKLDGSSDKFGHHFRKTTLNLHAVKKVLNDKFLCSFENLDLKSDKPHFDGLDKSESCRRGEGRESLQVLFLDQKMRIFHVISGYIGPKDFVGELKFTLSVFKKLRKARGKKARKTVAKMHFVQLKRLKYSDEEIEAALHPAGQTKPAKGPKKLGDGFEKVAGVGDEAFKPGRKDIFEDYIYIIKHPLVLAEKFDLSKVIKKAR